MTLTDEIIKWHETVYGPTTPELLERIEAKCMEEVREYLDDPAGEFPDVFISFYVLAHRSEKHRLAIYDKLQIIKARNQPERDRLRGIG